MDTFGIPYVGDTRYTDSEDSNIDFDLASTGDGRMGEDNEVSVMRILFDAVADGNAATSPAEMWAILARRKPENWPGRHMMARRDGTEMGRVRYEYRGTHYGPYISAARKIVKPVSQAAEQKQH